jgi:hypothetical protein
LRVVERLRSSVVVFADRQAEREPPFLSALDRAGDLVGCFRGGPADLSSNPEHLAGFGQV